MKSLFHNIRISFGDAWIFDDNCVVLTCSIVSYRCLKSFLSTNRVLVMKASLYLFALVSVALALSLVSCFDSATKPKDGACDAGYNYLKDTITITDNTDFLPQKYPLPKGPIVFYYLYGTKARFYSYYEQKNICTKEHFNVDFWANTSLGTAPQPIPVQIYGEIVWSAIFPSAKTTLVNGVAQGNYANRAEAGLKQVFGENPAEVDIYLNVEFETQGSYAADVALFKERIKKLSINFAASKHTK